MVELAVAPVEGAAAVGLAEWVALVGLAMKCTMLSRLLEAEPRRCLD